MKKRKPLKRSKSNAYAIRSQRHNTHVKDNDHSSSLSLFLDATEHSAAENTCPARKRLASEVLGGAEWVQEQVRLIPRYSTRLSAGTLGDKLEACVQVRMMLTPSICAPLMPPYQQLFEEGIPARLLSLLVARDDTMDLVNGNSSGTARKTLFEIKVECATSILLIMLSRNVSYLQRMLNIGVVEALNWALQADSSGNEELQRVLLWCLGLVATCGPALRDYVARGECLKVITELLGGPPISLNLHRQCVWTLKALCSRAREHPIGFSLAWPILCALRPVLSPPAPLMPATPHSDIYVLRDAGVTLLSISETGEVNNAAIVEAGLLPGIVVLLGHKSSVVQGLMLEVIGNMIACSDSDEITQSVIEAQALPALAALFSSPERELATESLWVVSNIAAGSDAQAGAVASSGALALAGSIVLSAHETYRVKKEAGFVLANAVLCSKPRSLGSRVESLPQLVPALEILLGFSSPDVLVVCLECLGKLCKVFREMPLMRQIKQSRIPQIVSDIQVSSKIELITDKASKLLDRYFSNDDDDEKDEDMYIESGSNCGNGYNSSYSNSDDSD